jgi:cyclic pyranopterin phosphate synthase
MPQDGVEWVSHNSVLRFEEMLRICSVLAGMGISVIKITGGEPLLRQGVTSFVKELKKVNGIHHITLTSNGVLLEEHLPALAEAGIEAVNMSIDTLNKERFQWLTRSDMAVNVLSVIGKAAELGIRVKVNCVLIRNFNEDDIAQLAGLAKDMHIAVRFIELMPMGIAAELQPLPADEAISLIEREYGTLQACTEKLGNGPAVYYKPPGFKGHIGFISAMSRSFCESCNRLRLTATGMLRPCLSSDLGLDLASLVREGASDKKLEEAMRNLVAQKPAGHHFGWVNENMFRIGG